MRLQKYLIEGISSILYHSTGIYKLDAILRTDKFNLSTSIGTSTETDLSKKGKFFYFSTTRHKLGGFSLDPAEGTAMLVLDGSKLANKYSGEAVDYWGPEFRKIDPKKFEAEDRIYSKTPQIDNASKYIKEIHVLVPIKFNWSWIDQTDPRNRNIRSIYKNALIKKIPIYFYEDKKDFLIQNKKNSVKVNIDDLKPLAKVEYRKEFPRTNYFKIWEELFYTTDKEKLSKRASDIAYKIAGMSATAFYFKDYLSSLEADIHNDKSDVKFTAMLLKMFKLAKVSSAKDFLLYLADKWGKNI
jgi:hypothetical protein